MIGKRRLSRRALSALVAAVLLVGVLIASGAIDFARDADRLESTVRDAGAWGALLFGVVMAATVAVGVPGLVFAAPASVLWPVPTATVIFLTGGMVASGLRFAFVRTIGREWVERRLPGKLRRWDDRLSAGGIWPVIVLRLATNLTAPADWVLALSRVQFRDFVAGTLIGRVPVTIVWMTAGGTVVNWMASVSFGVWLALAVVAGIATLVWRQTRSRSRGPTAAPQKIV